MTIYKLLIYLRKKNFNICILPSKYHPNQSIMFIRY